MGAVDQSERATRDRVVALFRDELDCRYLGDWTDRVRNSNLGNEKGPQSVRNEALWWT